MAISAWVASCANEIVRASEAEATSDALAVPEAAAHRSVCGSRHASRRRGGSGREVAAAHSSPVGGGASPVVASPSVTAAASEDAESAHAAAVALGRAELRALAELFDDLDGGHRGALDPHEVRARGASSTGVHGGGGGGAERGEGMRSRGVRCENGTAQGGMRITRLRFPHRCKLPTPHAASAPAHAARRAVTAQFGMLLALLAHRAGLRHFGAREAHALLPAGHAEAVGFDVRFTDFVRIVGGHDILSSAALDAAQLGWEAAAAGGGARTKRAASRRRSGSGGAAHHTSRRSARSSSHGDATGRARSTSRRRSRGVESPRGVHSPHAGDAYGSDLFERSPSPQLASKHVRDGWLVTGPPLTSLVV
eukprot:4013976-Prymnesium_polylepis.1